MRQEDKVLRLYLIRHAESYGNIKGKIISTTDFELTEKGIMQSIKEDKRKSFV